MTQGTSYGNKKKGHWRGKQIFLFSDANQTKPLKFCRFSNQATSELQVNENVRKGCEPKAVVGYTEGEKLNIILIGPIEEANTLKQGLKKMG